MKKKCIDVEVGDIIMGSLVVLKRTNFSKTIVFLSLENGCYLVRLSKNEVEIEDKH